jgi:membrane protease YdiL (CAAX protease family)
VLTSFLFGLAHYIDQGLAGVQQATIAGLVFGAFFAATGRIFRLMVAHAVFGLTARDDLLEPRIRRGTPDFQVAKGVT